MSDKTTPRCIKSITSLTIESLEPFMDKLKGFLYCVQITRCEDERDGFKHVIIDWGNGS